jgi:predicted site-specific integrase-resolvase
MADREKKIPKQVSESAREAGLSRESIHRAFDDGRLKGIRTASGQRLIDADSLAKFIAERRERKSAK